MVASGEVRYYLVSGMADLSRMSFPGAGNVTGNNSAGNVTAFSVILPVYNESNRLAASVSKIEDYLADRYSPFEVIIVEDHSTDGSYDVARRIASKDKRVVLIHKKDITRVLGIVRDNHWFWDTELLIICR